jgi:hypothetical protein
MDGLSSSVPGVRPVLERFTLARPPGRAVTREKRWLAVAAAYGLAGMAPLLAAIPVLIIVVATFPAEDLTWREGAAFYIAAALAGVTALAILPAAAFLSGGRRWGWTTGAASVTVAAVGAAMAFGLRAWLPLSVAWAAAWLIALKPFRWSVLSWRAVALVVWWGLFALADGGWPAFYILAPVVAGAADEAWELTVEPRLRPFDAV